MHKIKFTILVISKCISQQCKCSCVVVEQAPYHFHFAKLKLCPLNQLPLCSLGNLLSLITLVTVQRGHLTAFVLL